jgi:glucoamylase
VRRWGRVLACSTLMLSLAGATSCAALPQRPARLDLHAGTIAVGGDGLVQAVPDDPELLVPGTRVLRGVPDADRQVAAQRAWLAAGFVPAVTELGESSLVRDALLDLHMLSREHGVAVAGWSGPWHYVWPRDAALVASALARTGHLADAERTVSFFQRVQPASGLFHARYLPDGSGVPDDRGVQLDGLGWSLWAMRQVMEQLPAAGQAAFVQRHRQLLDRSSVAIVDSIDRDTGLPPASPDYWEVPERRPTLATAALLRSGLSAAAVLYRVVGATAEASHRDQAADRLAEAIEVSFGPDGYPRRLGGKAGSVDLGVAFLLPPFAEPSPQDGTVDVWRAAAGPMRRAAGGLSPGASWRDDGVSWNTATSSYAMTAAFVGERHEAVAWLRWLDRHRTAQGSLPEKVLSDGTPASVAPLAWAAAAVIIAADQLDS